MAKLILTEEEKAADLWTDLDDAAIGRMIRHTMHVMREVNEGSDEDLGRPVHLAAAYWLCGYCAKMNAATQNILLCSHLGT